MTCKDKASSDSTPPCTKVMLGQRWCLGSWQMRNNTHATHMQRNNTHAPHRQLSGTPPICFEQNKFVFRLVTSYQRGTAAATNAALRLSSCSPCPRLISTIFFCFWILCLAGVLCAYNSLFTSCVQGGEHRKDALSCRSLSAKEPPIIGLFCRKWCMIIRLLWSLLPCSTAALTQSSPSDLSLSHSVSRFLSLLALSLSLSLWLAVSCSPSAAASTARSLLTCMCASTRARR